MRVCFYTLGCKVNLNETGALEQMFRSAGFTIVPEGEEADVFVVNSCTVTNFGDQKSRKWLRRAKRENPGAVTVLTGCYPQAFPEEAAQFMEADLVCGNGDRKAILDNVLKLLDGHERIVAIKKAPEWTLNDIKERPVSLSDLKSKVILVNITGIGCGACQASIPFLKELKRKYQEEDFELVAIESWSRMHSLQNYAKRKELNYMFLDGDDKVIEDYRTGGAAPYFFILDKERIIRKVIRGYGMGKTDKEITEAIEELL